MFVCSMSVNELKDHLNWSHVTAEPDLRDIEQAITSLDGQSRTLVTLSSEAEGHMMISGGTSGRYLVYATFDWSRFHNLVQDDRGGTELVMVGRSEQPCPARMVVDAEAALQAARCFALSGFLEPSVYWEAEALSA